MARLLPDHRRQLILQTLESSGAVRVEDLARSLGVSPMTVHRDLAALTRQGRLRRVRGGALRASPEAGRAPSERCAVCGGLAPERTALLVRRGDGGSQAACCAHCGLLLLDALDRERLQAVLVPDFLMGRRVNAFEASFLVGPEVATCCSPSVLAFARREDAERFRAGFGGWVGGFEEALQRLRREMCHGPAHGPNGREGQQGCP